MSRAFRPCAKPSTVALKMGFRSGFEQRICEELSKARVDYEYEEMKVPYVIPASQHTYTPDFCVYLKSGKVIIVETKGRFMPEDRQKHLHVRESNPELDIRFVFQNPNTKITPTSKTTYAMWCNKNGFKWAAKSIPKEWLSE